MLAERPLRFGDQLTTGWDYFDYAPGQPNLFLLSRFKQLLVKEHGVEAGFEIYRRTLAKQKDASLKRMRLESHHVHSKARAAYFHETIAEGEAFTIIPPKVIGEGNHRPLSGRTRSFYVACHADAIVRGRSSVVEVDGVALADFQGDELARIDDEVEFDAAVFHRAGDNVWLGCLDRPAFAFDTAFSLLGCRTDFFGDWLCDSLTRYVAATLGGHLPPTPVLIDAHMPKSHRRSLEMMLAPNATIVEIPAFQPVFARRLWWAPGMGYVPFHQVLNRRFKWDYVAFSPRDSLRVEAEMMRRANLLESPIDGPTRVFLARRAFRHRKLANAAQIEAIATSFGFVIVYTEDLEFPDQARLLRRARHVVAPEGSSLFLCIFLGPGAKLCVLNHRDNEGVVLYNGGAEEKGTDLTIITGPEAGERRGRSQDMDYVIDPEVFRAFLGAWFDPAAPTG